MASRPSAGRRLSRLGQQRPLVDLAAVDRDGQIMDLLAAGAWTPDGHRAIEDEPIGLEVAAALAAWRAEIGSTPPDRRPGPTATPMLETRADELSATATDRPGDAPSGERTMRGDRWHPTPGAWHRGAAAAVLALVVLFGLGTLGSSLKAGFGHVGPTLSATTESHRAADRVQVNLAAAESALSRHDLAGALDSVARARVEMLKVGEVDGAADLRRRLAAIEVVLTSSLSGGVARPDVPPSLQSESGAQRPRAETAQPPVGTPDGADRGSRGTPTSPPAALPRPGTAPETGHTSVEGPTRPAAGGPAGPHDTSSAGAPADGGSIGESPIGGNPNGNDHHTNGQSTGQPSTGQPSTGQPSTGQPSTGHQSTGHQSTEHQSTEHQSTEHQSTEHEGTEHEGTERQSTERQNTERQSTEDPTGGQQSTGRATTGRHTTENGVGSRNTGTTASSGDG